MHGKTTTLERSAKRRILIIDENPLMRRGLTALIESEPDLIVCAEATTQREALQVIAASRPDLGIADLSLESHAGLALVTAIRAQDEGLPLVVLSLLDAPRYVTRALRAGASGYVLKQEMSETLLIAIRCVLGGENYVCPQIGPGLDTA